MTKTIPSGNEKNCTGCGLCSLICPRNCIELKNDHEGFLLPVINEKECVNCGLCSKQCPQNNCESLKNRYDREYFSAACKNKDDIFQSSSGGLFITFAKQIVSRGGVVCGCVYDDQMRAIHVCTDNLDAIYKMCGSKYVQSNIVDSLKEVDMHLSNGRIVLFSGTACQISAIKRYVCMKKNVNKNNLITVDILCHGVPSPLYFEKYVYALNKRYDGKVVDIQFRNKEKRGWGSEHRTCVYMNRNGKTFKIRPFLPAYFCAFFWGLNLRYSCYDCKYAGENRVSDITIGDFWGYWKYYRKEFPEGISICSVNTPAGRVLLESVAEKLELLDNLDENSAKGSNTNFYKPTPKPVARDGFYKGINEKKYLALVLRVFGNKSIRKKLFVSLYGKLMPYRIASLIRRVRHRS